MGIVRRIVVEHADGRRLSIPEIDVDNPDANPLNHAHDEHVWDSDRGETVLRHQPEKPVDDWSSLRQDGFRPVAYIHGKSCTRECQHDTDIDVQAGHEIALDQ